MSARPDLKPLTQHWTYAQVLSALAAAWWSAAYGMANALYPVTVKWFFTAADEPPMKVLGSIPTETLRLLLFSGAAWWWFRPMALFLTGKRPELREKALKRFDSSFVFCAGLWASAFLLRQGDVGWRYAQLDYARPLAYFAQYFLPDLFATVYAVYFTVLYLEPLYFKKVASRFHEEPAIFEPKIGPGLSLRAKLFLLVGLLLVVPMLVLFANLSLPKPENAISNCLSMITVVLAYAVGYCEMLYRGVTKPLDALVEKMEAVGRGDYSQRTTVLDDDEIGRLKGHFNDMVEGLSERERLKDTFGRYVSVEVAKQLLKTGKVSLGGESIEATILFSDIRDFTPMSERMTPQELVSFLNSYFSFVTEPITEHNGVVNKFIGDAVMAIFAPQFGSRDHAADGVKAALAMRRKLAEFNSGRVEAVRFGIGLHTGPLVAGNIGTEKRLEYTVIGDTVNLASRIESLNKEQDSDILISGVTHDSLPADLRGSLNLERRDGVRTKGKERPLTLYKVGA